MSASGPSRASSGLPSRSMTIGTRRREARGGARPTTTLPGDHRSPSRRRRCAANRAVRLRSNPLAHRHSPQVPRATRCADARRFRRPAVSQTGPTRAEPTAAPPRPRSRAAPDCGCPCAACHVVPRPSERVSHSGHLPQGSFGETPMKVVHRSGTVQAHHHARRKDGTRPGLWISRGALPAFVWPCEAMPRRNRWQSTRTTPSQAARCPRTTGRPHRGARGRR